MYLLLDFLHCGGHNSHQPPIKLLIFAILLFPHPFTALGRRGCTAKPAAAEGRQIGEAQATSEPLVNRPALAVAALGTFIGPSMNAEKRREKMLELVRSQGFASLPSLASELQVSESTVRRDLEHLEEQGATRRTHGGVLYSGPSPHLPHFDQRQSSNWERKRQVAARAAALVENGDTLLLDGGSTTYELARELYQRRLQLQIVTNSLPVATLFTSHDNVDLVLIGGYLHGRTGVTLGPYANQMLADLNVRLAVLSVAGITQRGYFNSNLLLVETERQMMAAADEVVVVADSDKFGRSSLALLGELGQVNTLVSDHQIELAWQQRLEDAGVQVLVAPAGDNGDDATNNGSTNYGSNHSSTNNDD